MPLRSCPVTAAPFLRLLHRRSPVSRAGSNWFLFNGFIIELMLSLKRSNIPRKMLQLRDGPNGCEDDDGHGQILTDMDGQERTLTDTDGQERTLKDTDGHGRTRTDTDGH